MHTRRFFCKLLMLRTQLFIGCLCIVTIGVLTGCSKPPTRYYFNPYLGKGYQQPEVKYCNDATGHKRGAYPFILGGTCCCTPSPELLDMYHEDGFLLEYLSVEELEKIYTDRGIVLRHKQGWSCNNQCAEGPHVVFGGKCMVPPVVGTQNYENVIVGKKPKP